jgi:hypothetical protein
VSRIVAIALRTLKHHYSRLRLVVSFADPEQGHMGTIYQAGGWLFAGMTLPADEYIVNGVRMHGRALRSTRSTHRLRNLPAKNVLDWTQQVIDPNARPMSGSSKYRYLMPLDDAMRKQIAPLSKPYPKRAGSILADASPAQGEEGGAAPTPALHTGANRGT